MPQALALTASLIVIALASTHPGAQRPLLTSPESELQTLYGAEREELVRKAVASRQ